MSEETNTNKTDPVMEPDNSLIIFKAISNFVKSLGEIFGKKQRSLALYARLIEKTTLSHEKPIAKHIEGFKTFCMRNKNALLAMDPKLLEDGKIMYSERVYINMVPIFSWADQETSGIIWKHLLTIGALVDPMSNAKQILKSKIPKGGGKEEEFLSNIIEKVEKCVDPTSSTDPMKSIASIMSSGVFNELVGNMQTGLQNGSLDIGKLMGVVQNVMGSLGPMNSGGDEMMGMIQQMTNMSPSLMKGNDEKKV